MADTASAAVLDFTDVKDGGGSFNKKRVPMGDYEAKITKVVDAPTKEKKEPQWLFTIELTKAYTDRKFPYYCKLESNQLWKIRNLFIAAGKTIPKKKLKLSPGLVVGKIIGVTLEDDEYDGKLQSVIVQTFPASDLNDTEPDDPDDDAEELDDDEEEEEPEPAPARRKKAAPDPEPEPEEEGEEEGEEEEEDGEDEEEEEPAPKAKIPAQRKTSPAAKKTVARRPAKKTVPVDDDELEELDLDDI